MHATADSRTVRVRGRIARGNVREVGIPTIKLPSRDIRRCPAIKLAVSRTHSVIGRIRLLTNSILTINIISAGGVLWGRRWLSMWFVFLVQAKRVRASQNNSEIGRVTVKWEVTEKICGYKAKMLAPTIIAKTLTIMGSTLFCVVFNEYSTSFFITLIIFFVVFVSTPPTPHSGGVATLMGKMSINHAVGRN